MILTLNYQHLNLHFTRRYITMHMCPCETKWLEKSMQVITDTRFVVVGLNLWHDCVGEGGELMASLFVLDSLHVLHGDILLKENIVSITSRCIVMAPTSNSSSSMHMVFLGAEKPATHWFIVLVMIFECVLVVMHMNFQLHVQLQLDLLLIFALVSVLNEWDHMRTQNDTHAVEFPCMQSTTLLTRSSPC